MSDDMEDVIYRAEQQMARLGIPDEIRQVIEENANAEVLTIVYDPKTGHIAHSMTSDFGTALLMCVLEKDILLHEILWGEENDE